MHGLRRPRASLITTIVAVVVAFASAGAAAAQGPTARAGEHSAPATTEAVVGLVSAPATTGAVVGLVSAPPSIRAAARLPVADVRVTATAVNGTRYATTTAANGWYDLEQLPAGTYAVAASAPGTATTSATVRAGGVAIAGVVLPAPVATVTGVVRGAREGPLAGIAVSLTAAAGSACSTAPACETETASGSGGRYTLHVPAGTYSVQASDAGRPTAAQTVVAPAGTTIHVTVALPAAPVPAGTTPHRVGQALRLLNAERTADGLPAGLTLSRRWSAECAAHDDYERLNGVLAPTENPDSAGASVGGAWAGQDSDLAEGRWTRRADPWEDAPIHLLALLAPSLKVVGIDDAGYQCATTFPGLVRAPTATDRIFTYPAAGATGVPPSELARESPFVPGQFVGIPNGRTTGRELFVYLDLAHHVGQAPVHVLAARLQTGGHAVALRRVDSSTPTVGRYLAGAILIPIRPLRRGARYTATVTVQDRSATLTHRWSFRTG